MREYTLYIWLGVWLFILPFLGIPGGWKENLLMLTALFIIGHALFAYRRSLPEVTEEKLVKETDEKAHTEKNPAPENSASF